MNEMKYELVSQVRPDGQALASLEIARRGEDFYCHLELGRTKWDTFQLLVSYNCWMEWDDSNPPRLRRSRRGYEDQINIARNEQQANFKKRLPTILQKDPDGWRVVDTSLTEKDLKLTFAHTSQVAGNDDDLMQVQLHFIHGYTCRVIND